MESENTVPKKKRLRNLGMGKNPVVRGATYKGTGFAGTVIIVKGGGLRKKKKKKKKRKKKFLRLVL